MRGNFQFKNDDFATHFFKKKSLTCTSTDALWYQKLVSLGQKMLALLGINTCGTFLPDGANEKNLNDNIIYVVTYVQKSEREP